MAAKKPAAKKPAKKTTKAKAPAKAAKAPAKKTTAVKAKKVEVKKAPIKAAKPAKKVEAKKAPVKAAPVKAAKPAKKETVKEKVLKAAQKIKEAVQGKKEKAEKPVVEKKLSKKEQKELEAKAAADKKAAEAAATEAKPKKSRYEDDEFEQIVLDFTPKEKLEIKELENKINDQISELVEYFDWKDVEDAIHSMEFFVDKRTDECIEKGCENLSTTLGYCRYHYILNWKNIQMKKEILKEGKLQQYIEELISKYPATYLEAIVADMQDEKEFYKVLHELNITSDYEFDEEVEVVDDEEDDDIDLDTREFSDVSKGKFED